MSPFKIRINQFNSAHNIKSDHLVHYFETLKMASLQPSSSDVELDKFHRVFHSLINALVEYTSGNTTLNESENAKIKTIHTTLVMHKARYECMLAALSAEDVKEKKVNIIKKFDEQVRPYYENVDGGKLDFVDKVPIMHDIGLSDILAIADGETVQNMLKYVELLVANTRMWCAKESGYAEEASQYSLKSLRAITHMVENGGKAQDLEKQLDIGEFMKIATAPQFQDIMRGAMTLIQNNQNEAEK